MGDVLLRQHDFLLELIPLRQQFPSQNENATFVNMHHYFCKSLILLGISLIPSFAFVSRNAFTHSSYVLTDLKSAASTEAVTDVLSVSLEKPLGLILEEVEEGQPKGVFVLELADEGSAAASEYKDKLQGLKVASVMGEDVTNLVFDDVMNKIIDAESPVSLDFLTEGDNPVVEELPLGTAITLKVIEEGKPESVIEAKVGDNLRQVLLSNNIEVYKGLKKKLGNCGGGGQCTFCAAEFIESDAWEPRSDYEDQKLKKSPNSRLTCLNNIQGPATIKI